MTKQTKAYLLLALSIGYLFFGSFSKAGQNYPQVMWIMGLWAGVAMSMLKKEAK